MENETELHGFIISSTFDIGYLFLSLCYNASCVSVRRRINWGERTVKITPNCNDCVYARFRREGEIMVCDCELYRTEEGPVFGGNGEKCTCRSFKPENKETTRQMCLKGFEAVFGR